MAGSFRFRWRMRASFPAQKPSSDGRKRPASVHAESRPVTEASEYFAYNFTSTSPGRDWDVATSASPNRTKLGLRLALAALGAGLSFVQGPWS